MAATSSARSEKKRVTLVVAAQDERAEVCEAHLHASDTPPTLLGSSRQAAQKKRHARGRRRKLRLEVATSSRGGSGSLGADACGADAKPDVDSRDVLAAEAVADGGGAQMSERCAARMPLTSSVSTVIVHGDDEDEPLSPLELLEVPPPTPAASVASPSTAAALQARWWRRGDMIGSGTYGKVYMAQDKATGRIFACKESRVKQAGCDDRRRELCAELQRELEICSDLRHPHIVSCLGHEWAGGRLIVFLEFVPGGSLRQMVNQFGPLEDALLRTATRGLLQGLDYLHTHQPPVVHRDLKGANVLVDLNFCVKLADFGCAKCDGGTKSFTTLGTVSWMAPEVLMHSRGGHGRKADLWSFGCVFVEMATAEDPWGPNAFDNFMHAMNKIAFSEAVPSVPGHVHAEGRKLAESCLQRQPDLRPWASVLLQHCFVAGEASSGPSTLTLGSLPFGSVTTATFQPRTRESC
eukprot:TRINITY_DN20639_c0_g2_i1.p1 TRINITY_DN20639_c0_g2~~TRINITY_DN20639_c0_g2_i1.p1  ORF type:complete len:466 (+),score=107.07 TRINITY_DN20639_c0_g2_i1:35-1432(+)